MERGGLVPEPYAWTVTPWVCVCGRTHAPWWRTVPPPSCLHGWPDVASTPMPPSLEHLVRIFGGPLPLPGASKEASDA